MKTRERAEARRLRRKEGRSIKEIARLLAVSPSSVSLWVRDIELTPEQHAALLVRNPAYNHQRNGSAANRERGAFVGGAISSPGGDGSGPGSRFTSRAACSTGRRAHAHETRSASRTPILEWPPSSCASFESASASAAIRSRSTAISSSTTRSSQQEIEQFWLDVLELPRSSLRRSSINRYSKYSKKRRKNKLPYGTCRLVVHSTELLQGIYGSIQEFAGLSKPEWLDC